MTLLELVQLIFVSNLLLFGNGPTLVPILQERLVDGLGVLSADQLLFAFAVARVTPGQANAYVASVGYFLFGIPGAILTTLAIQLPGYLMLPLISLYERLRASRAMKNFLRGLTAASAGVIFAAVVSLGQRSLLNLTAWIVLGVTLILAWFWKLNPILTILIASGVGILLTLLFGTI